MDDHQAAERVITSLERAFETALGPKPALISAAIDFFVHYLEGCHHRKEEEHLFPRLEARGLPRDGGPLGVMLKEHDQNRDLLGQFERLGRAFAQGDKSQLLPLKSVFERYATLMKQHFWKENDILYPMGLRVLEASADGELRAAFEGCEAVLGSDTRSRYYHLSQELARQSEVEDLSIGLDRQVLAVILNTLPVELSYVDADDTVRYFSHENSDKIFPRSRAAIGMKVQDCHPKKSVHLVNQIIADFRANTRNVAEFWIDFAGKKVLIRYYPLRGADGAYLGCLEVVQDITAIQAIDGQRRLLDEAHPG